MATAAAKSNELTDDIAITTITEDTRDFGGKQFKKFT
jgi:hypothetical protein